MLRRALTSTLLIAVACDGGGESISRYEVNLCSESGDCAAGETCAGGRCLSSCADDSDCPDPAAACRDGACFAGGGGGGCAADADCGADAVCVDGACASLPPVRGCDDDADCPDGSSCDPAAGCTTCDPARGCGGDPTRCTSDRDCPDGTACTDGVCGGACRPAAEVCDGLDNDCDGIIDEDCGSGACSADSDCAAGEVCDPAGVCVRSDPTVCRADSDCPDGTRCTDGVCGGDPSCTPSEEVCDGFDNDCDGVTDEGCDPAGACRADSDCPAGSVCADGTCVAR